MRDLQRVVRPTPQQREKIQAHVDAAVEALKGLRAETIARSSQIVTQLVQQSIRS